MIAAGSKKYFHQPETPCLINAQIGKVLFSVRRPMNQAGHGRQQNVILRRQREAHLAERLIDKDK